MLILGSICFVLFQQDSDNDIENVPVMKLIKERHMFEILPSTMVYKGFSYTRKSTALASRSTTQTGYYNCSSARSTGCKGSMKVKVHNCNLKNQEFICVEHTESVCKGFAAQRAAASAMIKPLVALSIDIKEEMKTLTKHYACEEMGSRAATIAAKVMKLMDTKYRGSKSNISMYAVYALTHV